MPTTLKEFESVFPKLVEDILAHCEEYNLPNNAKEWYKKVGFFPHGHRIPGQFLETPRLELL